MVFGEAIEAAKTGKKVARDAWNGRNQHVELATGISYIGVTCGVVLTEQMNPGKLILVGTPFNQIGWVANQADMLADDWHIVE